MIANYHTHTPRCSHAIGAEEDYVLAAIDRGFQILGFSDHTPWFYTDDYQTQVRMRLTQLPGYCSTIRSLRKKYENKIQIPLGLELEYYPGLIGKLLPILRDNGVEYLLLGQHYIGDGAGGAYVGKATEDPAVLKQYVRQCMEAMNTGLFTYLAHPDVIKFVGYDKLYLEQMTLLCREAKRTGMVLEMNMLGVWANRNYPDRRFWEIAAQEGCTAILGCDAHAPEHLHKLQAEKFLTNLARELEIPLLEQIPLRRL